MLYVAMDAGVRARAAGIPTREYIPWGIDRAIARSYAIVAAPGLSPRRKWGDLMGHDDAFLALGYAFLTLGYALRLAYVLTH
jgi:hypothetical protein